MRFTYIRNGGVRVVVGGHVGLGEAQIRRKLVKGIIANDSEKIRRVLQIRERFYVQITRHKIKRFVIKIYDG